MELVFIKKPVGTEPVLRLWKLECNNLLISCSFADDQANISAICVQYIFLCNSYSPCPFPSKKDLVHLSTERRMILLLVLKTSARYPISLWPCGLCTCFHHIFPSTKFHSQGVPYIVFPVK
jgi:hypothetical protein